EPKAAAEQRAEAADEKPRADEEKQRQRDLADYQRRSSQLASTARRRSPAGREHIAKRRARRPECRQHAGERSRSERREHGKGEHPAVEGNLVGARNVSSPSGQDTSNGGPGEEEPEPAGGEALDHLLDEQLLHQSRAS